MSMDVIYHHPAVKMVGPAPTHRAASTAPVHLGFQVQLVVRTSEIHALKCHVRMGIAANSAAPPISVCVIQTTQECWNVHSLTTVEISPVEMVVVWMESTHTCATVTKGLKDHYVRSISMIVNPIHVSKMQSALT